jgi:ribosome-binding protein aMBF1 (putative translation factor)
MTYLHVYQEWDILKEQTKEIDSKVEKVTMFSNHRPSFGFLLQQARIRKRMTTMDVANSIQIPAKMISLYESGTETPTNEMAQNLRDLLDI